MTGMSLLKCATRSSGKISISNKLPSVGPPAIKHWIKVFFLSRFLNRCVWPIFYLCALQPQAIITPLWIFKFLLPGLNTLDPPLMPKMWSEQGLGTVVSNSAIDLEYWGFKNIIRKFRLAPMGVLSHAWPSDQPPINTNRKFLHTCLGGQQIWKIFWSSFSPFQAILSTYRFVFLMWKNRPRWANGGHAKFENPKITPSGRKVPQAKRKEEERERKTPLIVDTKFWPRWPIWQTWLKTYVLSFCGGGCYWIYYFRPFFINH